MKILFLLLATTALLAGCASSPVKTADAVPVPADQIYMPASWRQPCSDCTAIIIKRDNSTVLGNDVAFSVNGTRVAALGKGQKATFYLPPGHYVLRRGGGFATNDSTIGLTLSGGGKRIYRAGVSAVTHTPFLKEVEN